MEVDQYSTHIYRRTTATLVERAAGLTLAPRLLDHANEQITRTSYVVSAEEVDPITVDVLDEILGSRPCEGTLLFSRYFRYTYNDMSERETINGVPVTEEQIAAWAAEAEGGYDVAALKKRGRGRPGRGAEPSQVVALRLTLEEIAVIDERAEREGKSRSEVIREALHLSAA